MRLAYRHHHRHHAHSRTHELRLWQKALLTAAPKKEESVAREEMSKCSNLP